MRRSSKLLPKDPNQLAGEEIAPLSTEEPTRSVKEYLAIIGGKGGLKGGPARATKLTKRQRHQIGKKAANARWSNRSEFK